MNNFELGRFGRYRTNVWHYAGVNSFRPGRREELAMHPTVKPVALVADAIQDCTRRGDLVLDPFAGSGTTLIAAERTGRRAQLWRSSRATSTAPRSLPSGDRDRAPPSGPPAGSPAPRLPQSGALRWTTPPVASRTSPVRRWAMVDDSRRPVRHRTRPSPGPQAAPSASSESPAATETWAHAAWCSLSRALGAGTRPCRRTAHSLHRRSGTRARRRATTTVGYGKPPKDSRFKKGRSGNPRGRPKGSKNLLTLIHEELDRPIAVREDGRSRKVRACDALAKRLVHKGLSGHDRSIELLFKLAGTRAAGGAVAPAEAAEWWRSKR